MKPEETETPETGATAEVTPKAPAFEAAEITLTDYAAYKLAKVLEAVAKLASPDLAFARAVCDTQEALQPNYDACEAAISNSQTSLENVAAEKIYGVKKGNKERKDAIEKTQKTNSQKYKVFKFEEKVLVPGKISPELYRDLRPVLFTAK